MDNLKKNIIFCPTCPKHEVLLAICDFRHLSHPLRNIKCDSLIFLIPKTNTPIMIINSQNAKIKKQKSVPPSPPRWKICLQSVTESGESKNYSLLFPLPSSTFPLSSFTKNTLLCNKIIIYFVLSIVLL